MDTTTNTVKLDAKRAYASMVDDLKTRHTLDRAMQLVVGGDFDKFGVIQRDLCLQYGLRPESYIVDVGCGSGRLAVKLAGFAPLRYLGIDVLPDFVAYAERRVARDGFRFVEADGLTIPEQNGQADFVVFFSVFTHLFHEQSYLYLAEAKRVLKPGGTIVFSFLEFRIPSHWQVFEGNLRDVSTENQLNMFMSRDLISAWADHLGFEIVAVEDGNAPCIELTSGFMAEDESWRQVDRAALGQSFCVLRL